MALKNTFLILAQHRQT